MLTLCCILRLCFKSSHPHNSPMRYVPRLSSFYHILRWHCGKESWRNPSKGPQLASGAGTETGGPGSGLGPSESRACRGACVPRFVPYDTPQTTQWEKWKRMLQTECLSLEIPMSMWVRCDGTWKWGLWEQSGLEEACFPLCHVRTPWEDSVGKPQSGPSPGAPTAGTLPLNFPASRIVGKKCQLLKPLGLRDFVIATWAD